jgi:transcriptional regulator with PAS, ATPase and Fis domain
MLEPLPEKAAANQVQNGASLQEQVECLERRVILEVLKKTGNNRTRSAEMLGISRFSLLRRMQKYGIE